MKLSILLFGVLFALLYWTFLSPPLSKQETDALNRQLLILALKNNAKGVSELISKGADVNSVHTPGQVTALILAAEKSLSISHLLVKHRANVNATDRYGRTALMKASYADKLDIVNLLLVHNADVTVKDKFGDTALTQAIYRGNPALVQTLLEKGANPRNVNTRGESIVMIAEKMVSSVKAMDDSDAHHHHHDDNDHVVTDKTSALRDRSNIVTIIQRNIAR